MFFVLCNILVVVGLSFCDRGRSGSRTGEGETAQEKMPFYLIIMAGTDKTELETTSKGHSETSIHVFIIFIEIKVFSLPHPVYFKSLKRTHDKKM